MPEVVGFIQLACALTLGMGRGLGRPPDGRDDGVEWVLIFVIQTSSGNDSRIVRCMATASFRRRSINRNSALGSLGLSRRRQ